MTSPMKGPWRVAGKTEWKSPISGLEVHGADHAVALVYAYGQPTEANANLIAAAPELYDALAELKRLLTGADVRILGENIATDIVASIVFDKADRALARARGEVTP